MTSLLPTSAPSTAVSASASVSMPASMPTLSSSLITTLSVDSPHTFSPGFSSSACQQTKRTSMTGDSEETKPAKKNVNRNEVEKISQTDDIIQATQSDQANQVQYNISSASSPDVQHLPLSSGPVNTQASKRTIFPSHFVQTSKMRSCDQESAPSEIQLASKPRRNSRVALTLSSVEHAKASSDLPVAHIALGLEVEPLSPSLFSRPSHASLFSPSFPPPAVTSPASTHQPLGYPPNHADAFAETHNHGGPTVQGASRAESSGSCLFSSLLCFLGCMTLCGCRSCFTKGRLFIPPLASYMIIEDPVTKKTVRSPTTATFVFILVFVHVFVHVFVRVFVFVFVYVLIRVLARSLGGIGSFVTLLSPIPISPLFHRTDLVNIQRCRRTHR